MFEDGYTIRQNELYSRTLNIDYGTYSDVGYRFRTNKFTRKDSVIPMEPFVDEFFYDFKFYN